LTPAAYRGCVTSRVRQKIIARLINISASTGCDIRVQEFTRCSA
jgi:hypothetical protein